MSEVSLKLADTFSHLYASSDETGGVARDGGSVEFGPFALELGLNILDLTLIAVTLVIAWWVWKWDRRNIRNALLWEVSKDHWRTALALNDRRYLNPDKDLKTEVDLRLNMLERTVSQIEILDGPESRLANAFENVRTAPNWADPNWRRQPQSHDSVKQREAVNELTAEMARKFGSRKAKKNAKKSKRNPSTLATFVPQRNSSRQIESRSSEARDVSVLTILLLLFVAARAVVATRRQ
jgi:hypothetical protein